MTEQPDDLSPYRPVVFPPFPDDGILPASAEDVMGLAMGKPGSLRVIVDFATGTMTQVPPGNLRAINAGDC